MTRRLFPLLGVTLLMFQGSASADLSGDYRVTVENEDGKKTAQMGKIYLQGEPDSPERAMRMEIAPDGASADEKLVFLTLPKQEVVYMLLPEAKSYLKMSVKESKSKAPKSPGQDLASSDFKTVGRERLNGQRVIVKEAPLREGTKTVGTMRVYLAPAFGNEPIKSVLTGEDGNTTTVAIENPVSKNLPDKLFEVPQGYSETKLPSISKMLDSMGEEAEEEAKQEGRGAAKEQKDSAKEKMKQGIRDKLPF